MSPGEKEYSRERHQRKCERRRQRRQREDTSHLRETIATKNIMTRPTTVIHTINTTFIHHIIHDHLHSYRYCLYTVCLILFHSHHVQQEYNTPSASICVSLLLLHHCPQVDSCLSATIAMLIHRIVLLSSHSITDTPLGLFYCLSRSSLFFISHTVVPPFVSIDCERLHQRAPKMRHTCVCVYYHHTAIRQSTRAKEGGDRPVCDRWHTDQQKMRRGETME